MKKLLMAFSIILFWINSSAQNMRLLEDFDKIRMSIKQFEAEGYMTNLPDYKSPATNNYDNYSYLQYSDSINHSVILLCFYKSVLYQKKLVIKYPLNQLQICKSEWVNLNKYIVANNKILSKTSGEITNKAYGGQIGYGCTYYLNNSTKIHKTKTADYNALLDIRSDNGVIKANLIGYSLEYSATDLSKTSLDAKTGFSSMGVN